MPPFSIRHPQLLVITHQELLQLTQRVELLVDSSPKSVLIIASGLLDQSPSDSTDTLLDTVLSVICDRGLLRELSEPLIAQVVGRVPRYATASSLWKGSAWYQREIFHKLSERVDGDWPYAEELVRAMLDAGSDAVSHEAVDLFRSAAIDAALDWASKKAKKAKSLPYGWERVIQSKPDSVLQWLGRTNTLNVSTAYLITTIMNPNSDVVRRCSSGIWGSFTHLDWGKTESRLLSHIAAFIFTVGMAHEEAVSGELLAWSFPTLHRSLSTNSLGTKQWSWLDSFLPNLNWFSSWDKCERLRRGLLTAFCKNGWPLQILTRGALSQQELKQLRTTAKAMKISGKQIDVLRR